MSDSTDFQPKTMLRELLDNIAKPARQVAARPDDFPKSPDLIAELETVAGELTAAAHLIAPEYPEIANLYIAAGNRVRSKVARAREIKQPSPQDGAR